MTKAQRVTKLEQTVILEQRKKKWEVFNTQCDHLLDLEFDLSDERTEIVIQSLVARHPWIDHSQEVVYADDQEVLMRQGFSQEEIEQRIDPPKMQPQERAELEQDVNKIKVILEQDDLTSDERVVCQFIYDANVQALRMFL